jgi:hypothetical protein
MSGDNGAHTSSVCALHGERIEALEHRMDQADVQSARMLSEIAAVRDTLGHAPDPVRGTQGVGAVGLIYRIGNAVLTGEARGPLESLYSEGETTRTLDRAALVQRSHKAEARVRLAIIGAVVTLITTVGAVLTAWVTR